MIAYTIEAALESELFDQVIVSTDNSIVAEIALKYGAKIPFLREKTLSDDLTPVSEVTRDVLYRLDSSLSKYKYVAQLLPNCPLRTKIDIEASFRQFIRANPPSLISMVRFGWLNPWWAMRLGTNQTLKPLFPEQTNSRSQDLEPIFCPTGAVWWIKSNILLSAHTFFVPSAAGWEMPWHRGLDIDTEDDWWLAKIIKQATIK
jgi:N-acylneuraminate cytidylyltransferase